MKKFCSLIAAFCLFGLVSCQSDQEMEKKETLSQRTEKIGKDGAQMMKGPLDQARKAAEVENNHGQEVEKEVGKPTN